ncbi:MAG: phosphoribosylamine--glycine ligase [Gemmatimonadales bacterium]
MRILVVGNGGREHALLWALQRELPDASLLCAPGNAGTATLATNLPISVDRIDDLTSAAVERKVELAIVGPEVPLALGLADRLRAAGVPTFGPSGAAAQIESSKAWAKDVMTAANVPTAQSMTFGDLAGALAYIDRHAEPLVVKASGLAAGKGAVVCATRREAHDAVRSMLGDRIFGEAGELVVIESFLEGEELSVFAVTDGRDIRILPPAQDHKRLLAGDQGPNTGGMGAYSPVQLATDRLLEKVQSQVLEPTLAEMARRGAAFTGLLYAGLMIDRGGNPSVVEFNCRLGDPETQVVLPRLDGGLLALFEACANGRPLPAVRVRDIAAVTTVLAAAGYPDKPERGAAIEIPDDLPGNAIVFHAGTARDGEGVLRVNGGRVLTVTGTGPTFSDAQAASRGAAERIRFAGCQYRSDIGWREAARTT